MVNKSRRALMIAMIAAVVIVAAAIAFLETAFFHVNPIKLGFHRFDYGRYFILSRSQAPDMQYDFLSAVMSKNESAVALTYKWKVQIIFCERQSDMDRYQPFASAPDRRNAVGFAPWPNTIYVTPKVNDKPDAIQNTFGHELSHILLIQNYGIIKMTVLQRRAEWIPEGFATYLNSWPYYFDKTELPKKLRDAGVDLSSDRFPSIRQLSKLALPIRFMIYRHFVQYLYQRKRADVVIKFLKEACDHPLSVPAVFESSFGDSQNNCWKAFWNGLATESLD
jgi:hypothetical protein